MRVKVYHASGKDPEQIEVSDDREHQLPELQRLIGGYIEPIHTQRLTMNRQVALVDEDGRTKGRQPNYRASLDIGYAATLTGTVVIIGEVTGEEAIEWTHWNHMLTQGEGYTELAEESKS